MMFRLREIGSDEELLQMASKMPTTVQPRQLRKQQKQKLKAQLSMVKLSDPIYNALNEAYVFNLSLEACLLYDLCHFVD
jgi:hypothetical protein